MKNLNNKKFIGALLFGAFFLTGFYNAVVLNSESNLSSGKFAKRLDEMYGVTTQGREVASDVSWHKITKTDAPVVAINKVETENKAFVAVEHSAAAVQEDLILSLIEVSNSEKWLNGLTTSQFNGSLTANNGVIESLKVTLPDGFGITISFTEMTGNVFEYEVDGKQFSGMMYQVDSNSFMVTLTNGPLQGTRMRFGGEAVIEDQQMMETTLAQNHHVEVGTFGALEAPAAESEAPAASVQAEVFNFDKTTI